MNAFRGPKFASTSTTLAARLSMLCLFVLAGYFIADLGTLYARQYMLPSQPPPARPVQPPRMASAGNYQSIVNRNIFSESGVIPEPLIASQKGEPGQELPPVPSQLPLTLMGTLVHSNPERSLAALEIKGKNQVLSYRPKMQIENLATLESVERMRIIIRNLNSGRLEFIEMKNAPKVNLRTTAAPTTGKGDVKKVSENEFEIKRADLLKYTSDLSSILMQARVVAARKGGSGEVYGFRLVEMQPGSIYSQLGLQVMDVLTCVNDTPVTSAQQAMEMYSTLRSASQIKLCVERGGRNQDLKYRIN